MPKVIVEYTKEEARVKKDALDCPYYFGRVILGYKQFDKEVHGELFDFIQVDDEDKLVLEPRNFFKTSCISITYVIWRLIKNLNLRVLINHKTLGKSKEILREIKQHFESNRVFRYFFGDWVNTISLNGVQLKASDTWGTEAITINRRTRVMREPSVSAGSSDHEATSSHYDLIINDDLVGLRDMFSEAEREKTLRYFKTLKYIKEKFGRILTVGTRWHLYDLYNWMLEKNDTFKGKDNMNVRIRQARTAEGKSYFPARFSEADLLAMEHEDPILFSAQMNNNPLPLESQLYKLDKLRKYDINVFKGGYHVAYCDPAFKNAESDTETCFFVLIIAAIEGGDIYIVDWITNRNMPEENELLIIEKIRQYGMRRLGMEVNGAQSEFARNIMRTMRRERMFNIIEGIKNLINKDFRIKSMHGSVMNNCLFREDWESSYKEAMTQLLLYPQHKYKDAPDGLSGLLTMITQSAPNTLEVL